MRIWTMLGFFLLVSTGCAKSHELSAAALLDGGADAGSLGTGDSDGPGTSGPDEPGGKDPDNEPDPDGSGRPDPGAGGNGGGGQGGDKDGGRPVTPGGEIAECVASTPSDIPEQCSECGCSESEECPAAIMACQEDCWGLIQCALEMCRGDMGCVFMNCMQFFGGGEQARGVVQCFSNCRDACPVQ